jgi:hypothetical protein
VSGFHILAFLRGGMTACALRAAIASWHLRVSYLRDPNEPAGLIDAQMFNNIAEFLFSAEILRDGDGNPLKQMPDVSDWFTNAYLAQ